MSTADTTVFVIAGVVSTGGLLVVAIIISISTLICIKRHGCMGKCAWQYTWVAYHNNDSGSPTSNSIVLHSFLLIGCLIDHVLTMHRYLYTMILSYRYWRFITSVASNCTSACKARVTVTIGTNEFLKSNKVMYTLHVSYHTERIEEHNTEPMYDYIDTDPGDILTNGNPTYEEVATTSDDHMNEGMRGAVDNIYTWLLNCLHAWRLYSISYIRLIASCVNCVA